MQNVRCYIHELKKIVIILSLMFMGLSCGDGGDTGPSDSTSGSPVQSIGGGGGMPPSQPPASGATQPGSGTVTQPSGGTVTQPSGGTATQPSGGTVTQPSGGTVTQPSGGGTVVSPLPDTMAQSPMQGAITSLTSLKAYRRPNNNIEVISASNATLSYDGTKIAFYTDEALVAADRDSTGDIYVLDTVRGLYEIVSLSTTGNQIEGIDFFSMISADGRFVTFVSADRNADSTKTNSYKEVFLANLETGQILRLTRGLNGNPVDGHSDEPKISQDGTRILFRSYASNLVANDTNYRSDYFVYFLNDGHMECVSRGGMNADIQLSHSSSSSASIRDGFISQNGRYVLFSAITTNKLGVSTNTNYYHHVYLRDLEDRNTSIVSSNFSGGLGNDHSYVASIATHDQNLTIAFHSNATNLVLQPSSSKPISDQYGNADIFVYDLRFNNDGTTTQDIQRISDYSNTVQADRGSFNPIISADGRLVFYLSQATNLGLNDTNGKIDVYVYTRQAGVFPKRKLVSVNAAGVQMDQDASQLSISGNGQLVVFTSYASNTDFLSGLPAARPKVFIMPNPLP